MIARKLTQNGILQFGLFIDSLDFSVTPDLPLHLLTDPSASEEMKQQINVDHQSFKTRYELAEYLDKIISPFHGQGIETDTGFWSWLSLFYFDQVYRPSKKVTAKGLRARLIPDFSDYRRYYRHLLAAPYRIFYAHRGNPSCACAVLYSPPYLITDLTEQLSSFKDIITSSILLEVATKLYLDGSTMKHKKGATDKKNGVGSVRRFRSVIYQFDLTFDISLMMPEQVIEMLPREFDRFKPKTT